MASLWSMALLTSILSSNLTRPSQQTFVLVKTYWRRLQDVFSVTFFCLPRRLEDVWKTSWRHNCKTSCKHVLKTSWKTSLKRLEDVLKTSWRHFRKTYCKYVFKTSSRGLVRRKVLCWSPLLDVSKTSWKTRNICLDPIIF